MKFLSRGIGYSLFLTNDEAVFSLRSSEAKTENDKSTHALPARQPEEFATTRAVLRMKLVKANPSARVIGEEELPGKSNYFIGNDPKKWRSDVPTFGKVKYEGVYPGIDLVYYGNQRELEYDFVINPGADPHGVRFDVRGAKSVSRDKDGDLVLHMGDGELRWHKPFAYQENDGKRREIEVQYVIKHGQQVGFEVASYDSKRPLTIDPRLGYSTYLGGSNTDQGVGIAVDSSGNAYIIGDTNSTDFPTVNPLQASNGGFFNAFVAKLNPAGSALVYSTYLGGSGQDAGLGIAVDTSGNAYITGSTNSTDFPTVNPLQRANAGGDGDAFVAKLNPTGSALVYSTYLGGGGQDAGLGIAVDTSGNAYMTGSTSSTDFPTVHPLQPAIGGTANAFVAKLNPAGSALVYSTYLGGSSSDGGQGIAVDTSGNAYVTGTAVSTDFPTVNPLQPASGGGGADAFVAKLNPAGSALVYSTYLGGSSIDKGTAIAVDASGNAYVTGSTFSTDFPTVSPLQPAAGGDGDAYVSKLNPTGSALVYSTYLGGSEGDQGFGIAVDAPGNAYVTGSTTSSDFPIVDQLPTYGGNADAFVAKLNPTGSALVYSTYLGGSGDDQGVGIAVDTSGNAYVTGNTNSPNFPTMNPLQPAYGGGDGDAFVVQIQSPPILSPPSLTFGPQLVGTTSAAQIVQLNASGSLSITSIVTSAEFAQTNNCGSSLPGDGSCQISVTFKPSASGLQHGTLTITDSGGGSPQTVALSGTGTQPVVTLSPASLTFGNQAVNITSTKRVSTLKNTGNGTLTITSIGITGTDSRDFAMTKSCGTSVAAGGSCDIFVTFRPSASGTRTAAVSITDDAPKSPQSLPLTGVGVLPALTLSPTSLTFPTQVVYTTSAAQVVTVKNPGFGVSTLKSITVTGPFGLTKSCGPYVNPGGGCTFSVTFKPKNIGALTGSLTVTDNSTTSPHKVTLAGRVPT